MVGPSKILTVSYGTFSCTLEGFDDSFSTMKAIAEYFRGLALDDRYFGAEPPTPDAEMLAQIAGREISRGVEAHTDGSSIVLRAAALSDQSNDAGDASDTGHDADTRAKVDVARKAAKAAHKAEKAKVKAAAKAARKAEKAAKADADTDANAKADADTHDDLVVNSEAKANAGAKESNNTKSDNTAHDTPESTTETAPEAPPVAAVPLPVHPDTDSLAAKLQRIRAVVGNTNDAKNATTDDLSEQFLPQTETPDLADVDQNDEYEIEVTTDPIANFDAPQAKVDDAESSAETGTAASQEIGKQDETASSDTTDEQDKDGSDMLARVMAHQSDLDETAAEPQTEAAETAPDVAAEETPAQPQDQSKARVIRIKRADFDAAVQRGEMGAPAKASSPDAGPDLGLLDGAEDLDDYLEDSDFTDTDMPNIDDADFADDLAAIKADFESNLAVETPSARLVDDETSNSDGDAASSTNETADPDDRVNDAANDEDTDVNVVDAIDGETADTESAAIIAQGGLSDEDVPENAFHAKEPQVDDAALDRLMSESDAQMQEPEGSRRRDAISQLKAAVAAKEAARQVGEPEDDNQDIENAFRNDLYVAVRPESSDTGAAPRPVVRSNTRTERPRLAPLKLVAAQRIDLEDADKQSGPTAPVVPRRVATLRNDVKAQATGSFAEFADNMGATELPDLLEAAAAYTAFVEGADEFSRPQILRRVRSVAIGEFNREDGLRSFADLLRAGRFTKVRNGRFQVAHDSRYNPERRAS
ncbi:hypothetical protein OAN307_c16190 [Octadecabacter antarcticus 307]|uniref:Lipoprotein n=1 Tax=Octadecabacter antarcticus 307 TaxID=391626 RepID=M9R4Z8_9RHOB|nr:hypothetical protein OAN307_c16190 [Octadecabacter antarcticus 307]